MIAVSQGHYYRISPLYQGITDGDMAAHKGRHALVMGASGISGWAIVNQLLRGYPQKGIFSKVTAVTNRPLSRQDTLWPESESLRLVSGLDLTSGSQQELQENMKRKITDIEDVTEVYFYGAFGDVLDQDKS